MYTEFTKLLKISARVCMCFVCLCVYLRVCLPCECVWVCLSVSARVRPSVLEVLLINCRGAQPSARPMVSG